MDSIFPYTYIACPCADVSIPAQDDRPDSHRNSNSQAVESRSLEAEEQTFDPRSPNSRFLLFPLDNLLYCEDCHEIRCPRCVIDEHGAWFCPSCLVEQPRGVHGGRQLFGLSCERSCFQCPICTAPATVNEIPRKDSGYILLCTFCGWDSTEINFINQDPAGFKGEMAVTDFNGKEIFPITELKTNLKTTQQLIAAGREPYATTEDLEWSLKHQLPNGEERFQMLRNFLANQIADTSASSYDLDQAMSYASPGSFTRIMGLYSNIGGTSGRKKPKPDSMREAYERVEGFQLLLDTDDQEIQKLKSVGWTGTLSIEQQQNACTQARFVSEGRPFVPLLKSRRSKRCRSCKHILVKPDSKTQSTRFRIKLVATNYIPTIKMQPLQPDQVKLRSLVPLRPFLMVLTLHNPLFDPVRVTLATPPHTPGNFSSKVTILCPQFEIGQNTDVWDEALSTAGGREKRRSKAEIADGQAEAGKIWEQGRNWTSVIVEIVPASLNPPPQLGVKVQSDRTGNPIQLSEDEDVLEIPMFVRVEYESESHGEDRAANGHDAAEKDQKEKRELVYWTVLGVGRIVDPRQG